MPPPSGSPTRTARFKRESFTISRTVGKALTDVMNNKESTTAGSSTESDIPGNVNSPTRARTVVGPKRLPATTRESQRGARPSLDLARSSISDKSPKLVKRPPPSSAPKPTRQDKSMPPPPPPSGSSEGSPSKPSDKPSKPRTSLTLRALSAALQPKPALPPSALPKYKPKAVPDAKLALTRSGAKKRLSDWDGDREEAKAKVEDEDEAKGGDGDGDEDGDDGFVNVERPISPLPRRAARKTVLPVSLSLTPSTPTKKGNILHKASSSLSSTPPRPPKALKTSTTSVTPVAPQYGQPSVTRPSSSASAHSQRATPVPGSRKTTSASRARTTPSARSVRRQLTLADSPLANTSKLESSPGNPFQLPETIGGSLLSPPLSPFLEGVSLDSLDAGDVSALLATVTSPVKPTPAPLRVNHGVPPETPSRSARTDSPPPQTPVSQTSLRPISTLATDPRQSVLSLRQFLENSGDLEHLLSQPLPSILTPDARERLLSFGFSPGVGPPPFLPGTNRPEPQTPCPVPDGRSFTSISQVLFPSAPAQTPTEEQHPVPPVRPPAASDASAVVELLKMQLASVESQRNERNARIESLEGQLVLSRDSRQREAAELSTQVSNLEEQLKELLGDRERESTRRTEELEAMLRDKDAEWERQVTTAVSHEHERGAAEQQRLLSAERRKWHARSAASAWECARDMAFSELQLIRLNRSFVEVTLAGLEVSMQQLRRS